MDFQLQRLKIHAHPWISISWIYGKPDSDAASFFHEIETFCQVLQSDPFEVAKWPFLGWSDLEFMAEKVTLKNQVEGKSLDFPSGNLERSPKRSHLGQLVSSAIDTFSTSAMDDEIPLPFRKTRNPDIHRWNFRWHPHWNPGKIPLKTRKKPVQWLGLRKIYRKNPTLNGKICSFPFSHHPILWHIYLARVRAWKTSEFSLAIGGIFVSGSKCEFPTGQYNVI